MTDPFRIDLRKLTDGQRELIEAIVEKLAQAGYDEDIEDVTHFYREAAAMARSFFILAGRNPPRRFARPTGIKSGGKPTRKSKGGDRHDPGTYGATVATAGTVHPEAADYETVKAIKPPRDAFDLGEFDRSGAKT